MEIYEKAYTSTAKRRFDLLGYDVMLLRAVTDLRRYYVPKTLVRWFIDCMLSRPVRWCLDRGVSLRMAAVTYLAGRKINRLLSQVFVRPFRRRHMPVPG